MHNQYFLLSRTATLIRRIVHKRVSVHRHQPLSLHDALPISHRSAAVRRPNIRPRCWDLPAVRRRFGAGAELNHRTDQSESEDRKSTRLNSSHVAISYAVFCLKKKKKLIIQTNKTSDFDAVAS